MIVPPTLESKERREHDLNNLRIYYMICEDIGIDQEETIQRSFQYLMQWAGKYKFLEEFAIFKDYVDKKKEEKSKGQKFYL
ncbi:hypothetical protein ENBRE01_0745 [Enteropsectra breve]|nr:hypothetical protein ENBRE01_0745 [Enteropsectra breve]